MRFLDLRFISRRTLPVLLQGENSDCALVCLAMVASFWGHQLDLPAARGKFSISSRGTTARDLMRMAESIGLTGRALRLDIDDLCHLQLPSILHWDLGHYVVLNQVNGANCEIHDPAFGLRRLSLKQLSKHFSGYAFELSPTADFRVTDERRKTSFQDLMGGVQGLRGGLVQLLALGVSLQALALLGPFFLQWIVDEAIVSNDKNLIVVIGLALCFVAVFQSLISGLRAWITVYLSTTVKFQWYRNIFAHLLKLPALFFERRHVGDIMSRFASIQAIQQSITTRFIETLLDGLLVVLTFFAMATYSISLTMLSVGAVFAYALLRASVLRRTTEATAEQIAFASRQQTHLIETVRGYQAVRLGGRAHERLNGWLNLLVEQFNAMTRVERISVSQATANVLLFGLERVAFIWIAALLVLDSQLTVGMMLALISFKEQFTHRVTSLIDAVADFRLLKVHGDRIAEVIYTQREDDGTGSLTDSVAKGQADFASLELRDVWFRYPGAEDDVLKGLNIRIEAGQCVAFTGPSGGGKTTLLKLLVGLLEPTKGEVLVNGVDIRRFGLARYRQLIGAVMQNDQLFSGSVGENIAFFDPSADFARMEESARKAAIHADINKMALGYQTLIGEDGAGLSGGQRQRVLLARALYSNPSILVLDEATSHLDAENEALVSAAVGVASMTRILAAHRAETLATAERVIVIEGGRVLRDFLQTVSPADLRRNDTGLPAQRAY